MPNHRHQPCSLLHFHEAFAHSCLQSKLAQALRSMLVTVNAIQEPWRWGDLRGDKTGVDEAHSSLARFIQRLSMTVLVFVAMMIILVRFILIGPTIVGLFSSPDASQCNELHEWSVGLGIDVGKPDGANQERDEEGTSDQSLLESQLTADGDLEEYNANYNAVADHGPSLASGVLPVIHGVQKLILVHEASNQEIEKARKDDLPTPAQHTVDDANDEDQNGLREVEAIAEGGGLDELGII